MNAEWGSSGITAQAAEGVRHHVRLTTLSASVRATLDDDSFILAISIHVRFANLTEYGMIRIYLSLF